MSLTNDVLVNNCGLGHTMSERPPTVKQFKENDACGPDIHLIGNFGRMFKLECLGRQIPVSACALRSKLYLGLTSFIELT
jgi:hypothetical protein